MHFLVLTLLRWCHATCALTQYIHADTASAPLLLPVGDSFANAIRLATGHYLWVLGDDDLPLLGCLGLLVVQISAAERDSIPMLQLQQHGCAVIDTAVEALAASCEPERFGSGLDLLTPHAFHWLGQMSATILQRRFFGPESLFADRREDEIIPLMRAVVEGLRAGAILCLRGALFARTLDAGNWQGMMAFAHAIEFPRYWQLLRDGHPGIPRPFQETFLLRMALRATLLRDQAPHLYWALRQVPAVGFRHRLGRLFFALIQPAALRQALVRRALGNDPRRVASLARLRDWDARVARNPDSPARG
jgi:hypothetical protein